MLGAENGGGSPQGNMEMPANRAMEENSPQMPADFDPSQLPEDFDPSQVQQDGKQGGGQFGQMQRPDQKENSTKIPGQNNEQTTQSAGYDKHTVIATIITLVILLIALVVVFRFNRRGR